MSRAIDFGITLAKSTAMCLMAACVIDAANAATAASPGVPGVGAGAKDSFSLVWTTVKEWTQGTLGKVMALAMVLVGIAGGIARQSLLGFVVGIGSGIGLYSAPVIIESIMGASLSPELLSEVANSSFWK